VTDAPAVMRPAPIVTDDSEPFWTAALRGELVIQRCSSCGRWNHPPRPMCPSCRSLGHEWVPVAGSGTVYSFGLLHHPQHPAFDYPVIAVLVELDERVRIVSNLVDVDPGEVAIGMPVEVTFAATARDQAVPVFRPRSA
jgi:uncharacterized OB-fold protein